MARDEALTPLMAAVNNDSIDEVNLQEQSLSHPRQKVFKCGKYRYPVSIFFIVGNEFCERFSYYGMKAILVVYFTHYLLMDEVTSTALYHTFTMMCYFSPVLGAVLADGWLGRYRTILYVSAVYAGGNIMMSLTAIPPAERTGPLISLFIIALCTGGIKPCVSAFGGDQFDPGQEKELSIFFSAFYFSINGGSLLSTFITPILRADVHCLGYSGCYPLAFGVPAVLMVAALGLFLGGRPLYRQVPPTSNTVGMFIMATARAIKNKIRTKTTQRSKDHWLHYANDKYDLSFLQDMRAVYQVLFLYLPLPFFWALFDQQGSRWTIQAGKLDGHVTNSWYIKPDQMQILNPLLVLMLIPVFDSVVYPLMNKLKIPNRPLQRMIAGMFFAVLAFLAAGVLEMKLKDSAMAGAAGVASPGFAVLNGMACRINGSRAAAAPLTIDSFQISGWLPAHTGDLRLTISGPCLATTTRSFDVRPGTAGLVAVLPEYGDSQGTRDASSGQNASLQARVLYRGWPLLVVTGLSPGSNGSSARISVMLLAQPNGSTDAMAVRLVNEASGFIYRLEPHALAPENITFHSVPAGNYKAYVDAAGVQALNLTSVPITLAGGVSIILLYPSNGSMTMSALALPLASKLNYEMTTQIPMALQIPQYLLISIGEVLFSITGLSFSYSQAPASMKSVLTAAWLLTVAIGNLIVVAVAEAAVLPQFAEFFLFAGLMFVDMCVFAIMTISYKYVESANGAGLSENSATTGATPSDGIQTSSE